MVFIRLIDCIRITCLLSIFQWMCAFQHTRCFKCSDSIMDFRISPIILFRTNSWRITDVLPSQLRFNVWLSRAVTVKSPFQFRRRFITFTNGPVHSIMIPSTCVIPYRCFKPDHVNISKLKMDSISYTFQLFTIITLCIISSVSFTISYSISMFHLSVFIVDIFRYTLMYVHLFYCVYQWFLLPCFTPCQEAWISMSRGSIVIAVYAPFIYCIYISFLLFEFR